jgi:plasminogen activator inhibitor 1 RNA-binding protein
LSAVPEGPVTSGEENNATDGDVAVDGTPAVDGEAAPVEQEEESKEMTLDEYKRLQSLEGKKKPKFDIRKPGEGQDTSKWKNTYLLDNKVEEELKVAVEHETEYEEVEVVSILLVIA